MCDIKNPGVPDAPADAGAGAKESRFLLAMATMVLPAGVE